MKKEYIDPEFEAVRIIRTDIICNSEKIETEEMPGDPIVEINEYINENE